MRGALAAMPAHLTSRSKCRALAARVVKHLLAEAEATDPILVSLERIRAAVERDPAFVIARDPGMNLAGDLARERLRRFEARGCRQLSPDGWQAETREIAEMLETRLAERFRRAAKNGRKQVFSPATCGKAQLSEKRG